jgi:hypothetical protein
MRGLRASGLRHPNSKNRGKPLTTVKFGLIAPKTVLVVAPELDRFAPVADVRREVAAARSVYRMLGSENALELRTPRDFNRFPRELQEEIFDYLAEAAARG